MVRAVFKMLSLAVLVTIGVFGIVYYRGYSEDARHIAKLQDENQQLKLIVDRLTDESRVAELLVTNQVTVNGVVQTTLLFQENARDGSTLAPKYFTILGNEVHLDALVIKFDRESVKKNDPLRGHSIALFTRIYGNHQSPDSGPVIDIPGHIPEIYQGSDPHVTQFETDLWKKFWRLADDPQFRREQGVRVPDGEGPWWPCVPEKLYTVTLDADGGLNVTSEPVKSIYRAALQAASQSPAEKKLPG